MKINIIILTLLLVSGVKGLGQTLIPYYDNGKYDYSDLDGMIKIVPKYEDNIIKYKL